MCDVSICRAFPIRYSDVEELLARCTTLFNPNFNSLPTSHHWKNHVLLLERLAIETQSSLSIFSTCSSYMMIGLRLRVSWEVRRDR